MKVLSLLLWASCALLITAAELPNIVMIFADDLGYGDLSCFGNPTISTPNLDRMSREGLKLTQWYSGYAVCSPSRAALMTGRLPPRNGMGTVFRCAAIGGLPENETTIAELLKTQGYTTGMLGKWHMGQQKKFLPLAHGFDYYEGVPYSVDMGAQHGHPCQANDLFCCNYLPWLVNNTVVKQPVPLEEIEPKYADLASDFIIKNKKGPFFLYMAHNHMHVAVPTLKQWCSPKFANTSRRGIYGDAVDELDYVVGKILDTIRSQGLSNNTLVIFTSDNGPWKIERLNGGTAGQLRGEKGSTWDGGIRMPALAWWPGKIAAGTETQEVVSSMDVFATLATLAGAKIPTDRIIDGKDMSRVLLSNGKSPHDFLFFWNGQMNDHRLMAVRYGSFKLHFITTENTSWVPIVHNPPLLFNIDHDPSELYELPLAQYPSEVSAIKTAAAEHIQNMKQEVDQVSLGVDPSLALCCDWKKNCMCD